MMGGIASVLHGVPRAAFDLDILIEPTLDKARRLLTALLKAGFATAPRPTPKEALAHGITIFKDRVPKGVQTASAGVVFREAWDPREMMRFSGLELSFISKQDLISSKRASGREVDLQDVGPLELSDENR
jgi:hypothetical protein